MRKQNQSDRPVIHRKKNNEETRQRRRRSKIITKVKKDGLKIKMIANFKE